MNRNLRIILIIFSFAALPFLIWGGNKSKIDKKREIASLNENMPVYAETSLLRVNKAVISIPNEDTLVGLENGMGTFRSKINGQINNVDVIGSYLKTRFVKGEYNKKDPRMDALAPMYIDKDMFDGSTYIVLFHDRGDVAIEKSYARIGGSNVVIKSIKTLEPDQDIKDEEYKVLVKYKQGEKEKEVTLAVIDGHFDPNIK